MKYSEKMVWFFIALAAVQFYFDKLDGMLFSFLVLIVVQLNMLIRGKK